MKILLNSPCNYYSSSELVTTPVGLAYIKSYCESRLPDCDIKIVTLITENVLIREKPDIVGLSCYTATMNKVVNIAKLCKQKGINVVVGGEQITTLPHLMTEDIDVGVRGEGEIVFLKLLKLYKNGWDVNELKNINNLVIRDENNKLICTEEMLRPINMDDLPIPDLLLGNKDSNLLCLISSRGCPYKCVFCATGWHKSVHWLSPERVVQTIEFHVNKYKKIRRIKFWDDLFTVNLGRVEKIVKLLEEKKLTRDYSYIICTRADHVNDKLLQLLKRLNCYHISMGMESGCDKTLKYINKGFDKNVNLSAAKLIKKYNFESEASFIIGFPYETNEDIKETYNFLKIVPLNNILVFLPIPYPGTELWNYAKDRGLVKESSDMDWEALDLLATMFKPKYVLKRFVVLSEYLTRIEIYKWLKKFDKLIIKRSIIFTLRTIIKRPSAIINRIRLLPKYFKIKKSE